MVNVDREDAHKQKPFEGKQVLRPKSLESDIA